MTNQTNYRPVAVLLAGARGGTASAKRAADLLSGVGWLPVPSSGRPALIQALGSACRPVALLRLRGRTTEGMQADLEAWAEAGGQACLVLDAPETEEEAARYGPAFWGPLAEACEGVRA